MVFLWDAGEKAGVNSLSRKHWACWLAVCTISSLVFSSVSWAAAYYKPIGEPEIPAEIESMFDAAALVELSTNAELYGTNTDRAFTPTGGAVNLMAAYIVRQEADWEQEIPIIEDVLELSSSARKLDLQPGERWLIKDLTAGMLLHGAQDAALVLCDHVAGSQEAFVESMNRHAMLLGMENTVYMNPLGSSADGQTTTVTDLTLLCSAVLEDNTLRELLGRSSYDAINGQTIRNRMVIMQEDSANYDVRVKGFAEGSTASAGTNTLLYIIDEDRICLFIGYKAIDDQLGGENDAITLTDFFLDTYEPYDATNIINQMLELQRIDLNSGAIVTLGQRDAQCMIALENSVLEAGFAENNADFEFAGLPAIIEPVTAGAEIGAAPLLYKGETVTEVFLVVKDVQQPAPTFEIAPIEASVQPTPTLSAPPVQAVVIPVYSAEDWEGLIKAPTFMDQYGAYIVIGAVVLLATAVLFAASRVRKKTR